MSKKILMAIVMVVLNSSYCFSNDMRFRDGQIIDVEINSVRLKLVAAVSDSAKAKGLSDTKEVPYDGMIFIFDKAQNLAFWMKDMNYYIDIVWLSNGRVAGITENIPPPSAAQKYALVKYYSPQDADVVIELSSGRAKQLNIKMSDMIYYKDNGGENGGN
jgi:uncharacterized membrane protein (UPF0127 family)